mmetsp:Transcript_16815/g.38707  ORF Transcript_16815/g.38707 Transcript_16815/m.38707 type:complete len:301 (-) Transcript_16815:280-1182(-)
MQKFSQTVPRIDALHMLGKSQTDKEARFVFCVRITLSEPATSPIGVVLAFEKLGRRFHLQSVVMRSKIPNRLWIYNQVMRLQTCNQETQPGLHESEPFQEGGPVVCRDVDLQVVCMSAEKVSTLKEVRPLVCPFFNTSNYRRGISEFRCHTTELRPPHIVGRVHGGVSWGQDGHKMHTVSLICLVIPNSEGRNSWRRLTRYTRRKDHGCWPIPGGIGVKERFEERCWLGITMSLAYASHENSIVDPSEKSQHIGVQTMDGSPFLDCPQGCSIVIQIRDSFQQELSHPCSVQGTNARLIQA